MAPGNLPRLQEITIDVPALLFMVTLSLFSGLFFGMMPVLRYARAKPAEMLRGGGRSASASKSRHRARNLLVVAQVAVALVLLVSSGLMIRTFQSLKDVHPGFARPEEVLTFRLSIPLSQVKEAPAVARMEQAIADRIAALPGVSSAALASTVTMSGQGWHDPLFAEDHTYTESQVPPIRLFKFVSPGYVQTMGASLGTSGFVDELSQAIWAINPNLPLASVRTLQEIYDGSLERTSFTLVMLAIAGGMALVLGVAGTYGVMSYAASERTREIGIRIALGHDRLHGDDQRRRARSTS